MTSRSWQLVLWGTLVGITAAVSPGTVFVLALVGATGYAIYRWNRPSDRVFLTGLFVSAFLVRALLSLTLDAGSCLAEGRPPSRIGPPEYWDLGIFERTRDYLRMGDSDYYSQRGYCLAQYAQGNREPVVLRRIQEYGWHAYALVIGWFYYVFGFSPISVKFLNAWLGALLGITLFHLARSCFQSSIARWAALWASFFPSLVFWSASNLKEPLFFLLTSLILILFLKLQGDGGIWRMTRTAVLLFIVFQMHRWLAREEFSMVLMGSLLLAWGITWLVRKRWFLLLSLAGAAGLWWMPWDKVHQSLSVALYRHMSYVQGTGMIYRYLPAELYVTSDYSQWRPLNKITLEIILAGIPRALWHYFLEPFPSRTGDLLSTLFIPQMILWYFLFPLILVGMGAGLLRNFRNNFFLVLSCSGWALMSALSIANIGTLIRLRDMTTPFLLIFAAAGFWVLCRGFNGFITETSRENH